MNGRQAVIGRQITQRPVPASGGQIILRPVPASGGQITLRPGPAVASGGQIPLTSGRPRPESQTSAGMARKDEDFVAPDKKTQVRK